MSEQFPLYAIIEILPDEAHKLIATDFSKAQITLILHHLRKDDPKAMYVVMKEFEIQNV